MSFVVYMVQLPVMWLISVKTIPILTELVKRLCMKNFPTNLFWDQSKLFIPLRNRSIIDQSLNTNVTIASTKTPSHNLFHNWNFRQDRRSSSWLKSCRKKATTLIGRNWSTKWIAIETSCKRHGAQERTSWQSSYPTSGHFGGVYTTVSRYSVLLVSKACLVVVLHITHRHYIDSIQRWSSIVCLISLHKWHIRVAIQQWQ